MTLLRSCVALVWMSFGRLLWSGGTLMVLLPIAACALVVFYQRAFYETQPLAALNSFSHYFVINIFGLFLAPIIAITYATSSIGGDREDRTLLFLLIRPIPRWLLLLAKYLATLPLVVGISVLSFTLYCYLAGDVGRTAWGLYLSAVFYMAVAYTSVFHLFAVLFRHSTIVALIYSFFVEFILGVLPGVIKRVAVNYYGRSLMYSRGVWEGLQPPPGTWFEPLTEPDAEASLLWISVITLLLAMLIFQRREFRDLT